MIPLRRMEQRSFEFIQSGNVWNGGPVQCPEAANKCPAPDACPLYRCDLPPPLRFVELRFDHLGAQANVGFEPILAGTVLKIAKDFPLRRVSAAPLRRQLK